MIITPLLIVFLCVVFVLLFLFIKTIDKRKWLTIIVSLALTPIVYFYMFYPFLNIICPYHHQKHFDAEAWEAKPGLRYEMIDALTDSNLLIGKSKPEVKSLLGNYEWLGWNSETKTHNDDQWNYGLGLLPGAFNNDKENVTLVFKDDKVVALKRFQETIDFKNE